MADVGDGFAATLHNRKPINGYAKRGSPRRTSGEDAWMRQCSGMSRERWRKLASLLDALTAFA
jgi:hypothetical protein